MYAKTGLWLGGCALALNLVTGLAKRHPLQETDRCHRMPGTPWRVPVFLVCHSQPGSNGPELTVERTRTGLEVPASKAAKACASVR